MMNNNVETISATEVTGLTVFGGYPEYSSKLAQQGISQHRALLQILLHANGTFSGYGTGGIPVISGQDNYVERGEKISKPLTPHLLLTAIPDAVVDRRVAVDFKPPSPKNADEEKVQTILDGFRLQTVLTSMVLAHEYHVATVTAIVFQYKTEIAHICIGAMQSMWSDLDRMCQYAHEIITNQNMLGADGKREKKQRETLQRSFFDPVPISPYRRDQMNKDTSGIGERFFEIYEQFRSQAKHEFQQV